MATVQLTVIKSEADYFDAEVPVRNAGFGVHLNSFFLQIWCIPWDVGLIAEVKRQVDAMTVEEYQSKPTATPRATTIIDSEEVYFEFHDHDCPLILPSAQKIDEQVFPSVPDCKYILHAYIPHPQDEINVVGMIASKSECQLSKNPRFIPRNLRERHENPNQSYVRTPRNAVKGEGPLQRARKQSDPDPQWDLSFVLWKIEIGSIKRKRNCDLCDLSCILWKIKIGSIKCKRNCDPCDLSCILWKIKIGSRKLTIFETQLLRIAMLKPESAGLSMAAGRPLWKFHD